MREEEKKRISQPSKVKQLFRKRWVFPAIYLVSAAIILTAVLWFQANNKTDLSEGNQNDYSEGTAYNEDAVEVNTALENLEMPVSDEASVVVKKNFYDDKASAEEQEAALVFYNNTYHPNTGIDLAMKDGNSFDVIAAASGTVTKAEKDPLLGFVVEIDHKDGLVTQYQSLESVNVEAGDTVEQGQAIAKAGQNLYNQEAKTHVHFEVRKNGVAVNPNNFFGKPLATVKTEQADSEEKKEAEKSEEQSADSNNESAGQEESSEKEEQADETGEESSSTSS